MVSLNMNLRCCNLDWLEVHAREPLEEPHDAYYFRQKGYVVHEREYGTRVYKEMFTLEGVDGEPLLEVRRNPASSGLHGIHELNETHIRLKNRTCYFNRAAGLFHDFLQHHNYTSVRISRVDICLDFERFDSGDYPANFIRRYFRRTYSKVNQGDIRSHGKDGWHGQEWNSVAWGSPSSDVSTKFYNKTMELFDPKLKRFRKPYILQAWRECGIIDDIMTCSRECKQVDVWRLEFSIKSSKLNWFRIDLDGKQNQPQSLRNTLLCYDSRDKLVAMFAALQQHYFRFKYFEEDKPKNRCKDKVLFSWGTLQMTYEIERNDNVLTATDNFDKTLAMLKLLLKEWREMQSDKDKRQAALLIIETIEKQQTRMNMSAPWSAEKERYMRLLLAMTTRFQDKSVDFWMNEIKAVLKIRDHVFKPDQDADMDCDEE